MSGWVELLKTESEDSYVTMLAEASLEHRVFLIYCRWVAMLGYQSCYYPNLNCIRLQDVNAERLRAERICDDGE